MSLFDKDLSGASDGYALACHVEYIELWVLVEVGRGYR